MKIPQTCSKCKGSDTFVFNGTNPKGEYWGDETHDLLFFCNDCKQMSNLGRGD